MEWSQAVLRIDRPRCGAAQRLQEGQRLRCINAGGQGSVLGHLEGASELPGWQGIQCGDGDGYQIKADGCQDCPMRALPADVLPLQVEVHPSGVQAHVVSARPAALAEAYHNLRRDGQAPHVRRSGRLRAGAPATAVDLSVLTNRQREALQAAVKLGYFDSSDVGVDALGEALGCSRSTAHEHLRRGLQRLLGEVFN